MCSSQRRYRKRYANSPFASRSGVRLLWVHYKKKNTTRGVSLDFQGYAARDSSLPFVPLFAVFYFVLLATQIPQAVCEQKEINNCFLERCPTKQEVTRAKDLRRRSATTRRLGRSNPGVDNYCFIEDFLQGFDSRRELRGLVVRRENSSTGRVFYTAPTSNPIRRV